MHLRRLTIGISATLLVSCGSTNYPNSTNTTEISGVEPSYEPYSPSANRDYSHHGVHYPIVRSPNQFSETGSADIDNSGSVNHLTAIGEPINPTELAAAHPTLPIPSYVRITNLMNGRTMVIRVNDRGPYGSDKTISVSQAVADKLNLTPTNKIKIDAIVVSSDGSLSGPGSMRSQATKQTSARQERTQIITEAPIHNEAHLEVSNPIQASVSTPIVRGAVSVPQSVTLAPILHSSENDAENLSSPHGYLLQVGALSNEANAHSWQEQLSSQFRVPGQVQPYNAVFRVQLGPFSDKNAARELQQRLQREMNQASMIINSQ